MSQTIYPDTEVAYWVIPADDTFSVEVVTQWNHPRTVSPFATAADAKAWIAEYRRRVQLESEPSHWFRTSVLIAQPGQNGDPGLAAAGNLANAG